MTPGGRGVNRRRFLAGVATGTALLAGCLGSDDTSGDEEPDDGDPPDDVDDQLVLNGLVLDTAFPLRLVDPETDQVLADVHYHTDFRHWHNMPLSVPAGERTRLRLLVSDHNGEAIPLGEGGELQAETELTPDTPGDLLDIDTDGEYLELYGNRPGDGGYEIFLLKDDEVVWETPELVVQVE